MSGTIARPDWSMAIADLTRRVQQLERRLQPRIPTTPFSDAHDGTGAHSVILEPSGSSGSDVSTASAEHTVAAGFRADANATDGIAVGYNTGATAAAAVAVGAGATANGSGGIAVGTDSTSDDGQSVAVGAGAAASHAGTVVGASSSASGDTSLMLGAGGSATGSYATAVGPSTLAGGADSVCAGRDAKASASAASAFGKSSWAKGAGSVAIGSGAVTDTSHLNSVALAAAAATTAANQIMLGTTSHTVEIPYHGGGLILTDGSGGRWRVTVDTSGNLGTTAA